MIVLDDPLSAVDTHTEHELVGRLRPALAGRTVLVATQRLSTLALADRAVVLRDGRVVEDGRAAPTCSPAAARSPPCSGTRSVPRSRRTGLTRLGGYLRGRWLLRRRPGRWSPPASAAAQTGGWLLVRAAIDDGIAKGDEHTLTVVVVIYLAVNALGWM